MHKKNKTNISVTTDDEDDVPLTMMTYCSNKDPNSYDSLILPSEEPCELCDRVSKNRYTSIVHNAHHIIIPLLNQTVHQCDICLHHFTSHDDLIKHKSKKHTLSEILSQTDLVKTHFNNPTDLAYESDLITIVKKEIPIVKKESLIVEKESMIVKKESPIVKQESPLVKKENVLQPSNNGGISLKNRLIFEEDLIRVDYNKVLNDLTTDCQVQVELFPPIWDVEYSESIHYEQLVKPGVYRCRKCSKTSPTKFETIIHESQHIIIKNSQITLCELCNQYILGDYYQLQRHIVTIHSKIEHNMDVTKKQFGANQKKDGVASEPLTTKITTLKLCEMCFSFCKNKSMQNYDCVGELNEIGKRYICEKCGYKFFAIKLVKRKIKYSSSGRKKRRIHGKAMSNEDRLKVISQRFKRMKKSYFVVLFT